MKTSSIFSLVLCLIVLFYMLFFGIKKHAGIDDSLTDIIGSTVALLSLLLTIITIYFIYKTYRAQKFQILIQQKEIDKNRKDVEYNRTLDIIFKQLEFSKTELKYEEENFYEKFKTHSTVEDTFENLDHYNFIFKLIEKNYVIFDNILSKSDISDDEKQIVIDIIGSNFNYKMVSLYLKVIDIIAKYKNDYKKDYENHFFKKYLHHENIISTNYSRQIDDINNYVKKKYKSELEMHQEKVIEFLENINTLNPYVNKYPKP